MLVVQQIVIVWHKSERGGECAEARSKFSYTAPIEGKPHASDECLFDYIRFYQGDSKFYTAAEYDELMGYGGRMSFKRANEPIVKLFQLKERNVSFAQTESGVEVGFSYDPQINGKPCRQGHNKDFNNIESRFYGKDILNETAFVLNEGQKGRVMYNGRFTDYDTGQWWYEQTAVNIANISFENFHKDIFLDLKFDFTYSKLAYLK